MFSSLQPLRVLMALPALASTALAGVRLHSARQLQGPPTPAAPTVPGISGDTHFRNLVAESMEGNRPGDYELLRMPADVWKPALLNLRGTFLPSADVACGMYMKNFTLKGEWLGGKVLHVRWADGLGFELKVSSLRPPVAGQWSSAQGFDLAASGLPETIEIQTVLESPAMKFLVGPRGLRKRRPTALLAPGDHHGLDLSLSNTKQLNMPAEHRSAACELRVNPQYTIKGDVHTWNLAGEGLDDLHKSASQSLLRIPKAGPPLMFDVRGTFAATSGEATLPCGLHMTNLTLSGQWLGGKVLHVGWLNGFAFKVSSTQPAYAGPWRPLAEFAQALSLHGSGAEALPETVEMTEADDGTSIRFHVGTQSMHLRPTLHVTQGPLKGLDYAVFYTRSFDPTEPTSSLLGTEGQDQELEQRTALCKAMRQNASQPRIPEMPSVSAM